MLLRSADKVILMTTDNTAGVRVFYSYDGLDFTLRRKGEFYTVPCRFERFPKELIYSAIAAVFGQRFSQSNEGVTLGPLEGVTEKFGDFVNEVLERGAFTTGARTGTPSVTATWLPENVTVADVLGLYLALRQGITKVDISVPVEPGYMSVLQGYLIKIGAVNKDGRRLIPNLAKFDDLFNRAKVRDAIIAVKNGTAGKLETLPTDDELDLD